MYYVHVCSLLLSNVCVHVHLDPGYRNMYVHWLYISWCFSCYSVPIHCLVHGHMTSNNETVSRQMPRAGNIVKTMTSNGKQFTCYPLNIDRCYT